MVQHIWLHGRKTGRYDLPIEAETALAESNLLQAVAGAARGMMATAALLRSDRGARQLARMLDPIASSHKFDGRLSVMARSLWSYVATVTSIAYRQLEDEGCSASGPTSEPSRILDALVTSELLAAAASAVVDGPSPFSDPSHPAALRHSLCFHIREASVKAASTMYNVVMVQGLLQGPCGGGEGRRLALGLMHSVRHEAVQRLQMGLLDQLAAHAGMGAELQHDGKSGSGTGGKQQGREEKEAKGGGWVARSGAWWLANEEAKRGHVIGVDANGDDRGVLTRSRNGRRLQKQHVTVLYATIAQWHGAAGEHVPAEAEAGVTSGPPPLLRARLTARAAEALCRLGRGQGLGGTYASVANWPLARDQVGLSTWV